jgi:hypothetical protein
MRQTDAIRIGREMIRNAINREQAVSGMIHIACGQIGRDICSPVGRQRLINAALARLTQPIVYAITDLGRLTPIGMLAVLRQHEIILF